MQTPPRDLEVLVRLEREVRNACAALWGGAAGCCLDARTGDALDATGDGMRVEEQRAVGAWRAIMLSRAT